MKRFSFITQFKTEFLLPFTGYRRMLGKMPDQVFLFYILKIPASKIFA